VVADDSDDFRRALARFLSNYFEILDAAADGRELINSATLVNPDVIVSLDVGTDLRMIQLLLGRSDLEETTIYLHISKRQLSITAGPLDSLKLSTRAPNPESPASPYMD
jgi:hypothetical protein